MTNLKRTLLSVVLLTTLTANRNCPWGNNPVCGIDHITYPNQCALAAAYVEQLHPGPCVKVYNEKGVLEQNCPQTYLPVCGRDGVTYMNKCTLEDNKMDFAYNGPCDNDHWKPHNPPLTCRCLG